MSTVTDILAKIDAKISTILDSPDSIADYKIGDKSVSKSQILNTLMKAREHYQKQAESVPYEDVRHIAYDIDEFGDDISEYVGDKAE